MAKKKTKFSFFLHEKFIQLYQLVKFLKKPRPLLNGHAPPAANAAPASFAAGAGGH
nr:hypothetical protein [uncultured Desulfobulbus sp.]